MKHLALPLICLLVVFAHHPASCQAAASTSPVAASTDELLGLDKRISAIYANLLELERHAGPLSIQEREVLKELASTCEKVRLNLGHAMDVLFVYEKISSVPDRARVRKEVLAILKERITSLDYELERANKALVIAAKIGIVSAATELKSTIRHIIDVLDAVKL